MQLNNHSYAHKQIRALCFAFEQVTGLKLVTNLDNDFTSIRFASTYSYVTIDFLHNTYFLMCIKLNAKQFAIAQDIMLNLCWLHTGEQVKELLATIKQNKKKE